MNFWENMQKRKSTVASERLVLFTGAMLIAMLSVPFIQKAIIPTLESAEPAQAMYLSHLISSTANALSSVEQGYVMKKPEKPLPVEIYLKDDIKCRLSGSCGWYARVYYSNGKNYYESKILGNTRELEPTTLGNIYITKKLSGPVEVGGEASGFCREVMPKEIDEYVEEASKKFNVDRRVILAIIKAESDFNHCVLSEKGAIGLMQVMPETGREMGYENLADPRENILAGTEYYRKQLDEFGSRDLALAAYNAGPARVRKCRCIPEIKETQNYVKKINKYLEKCCTDTCTAEVLRACSV
ncbi:MAG TPA: lytic transglycosylase domain-containing protein [Candidatus Aenigmarchaeota archaeon]|nr:lytic transglycosylase domain-containing protein [Candidatus Aenigmarchaeota archaeon]